MTAVLRRNDAVQKRLWLQAYPAALQLGTQWLAGGFAQLVMTEESGVFDADHGSSAHFKFRFT